MIARQADKRIVLLSEVTGLLDGLNINYRLGTGALLGAIRDGDFIPWDWDIGLDIAAEQLLPNWDEVWSKALACGFAISKQERTMLNGKICLTKDGIEFELMGWRRCRDGSRRRRRLFIPANVWGDRPKRICFRGLKVYSYPDPEKFLAHFYGDWRTPVHATTKSDKASYISREALVRDYVDTALYLPQFLKRKLSGN